MKNNYSDTIQSYRVVNQAPLDAKLTVNTLKELKDLGPNNNKAFTYYRGLIVYCHEDRKYYRWVDKFENNNKVLPTDFIYPPGSIFDEIDYSNLAFNFVEHYTKGNDGVQGSKGDKPAHEWDGSKIRFENPDGSWGMYTNLLGPTGPQGPKGENAVLPNILTNLIDALLNDLVFIWTKEIVPDYLEIIDDPKIIGKFLTVFNKNDPDFNVILKTGGDKLYNNFPLRKHHHTYEAPVQTGASGGRGTEGYYVNGGPGLKGGADPIRTTSDAGDNNQSEFKKIIPPYVTIYLVKFKKQ